MADQITHYLDTVNADKDPDGRFLITGAPVIYGIGGDECVVSDAVNYLSGGKPKQLAAGLCSTSYGVPVKVF